MQCIYIRVSIHIPVGCVVASDLCCEQCVQMYWCRACTYGTEAMPSGTTTQLTLCSQCRYTVIQTMRSRSARRSPFTEWCWAEPFSCANMAISPTSVCVGNERVESQCSVLPRPAEVTVALNMIQKSLIVKYSNTSLTRVLTMEHHSKAIHWFMHQLSLHVLQPNPPLHPHTPH